MDVEPYLSPRRIELLSIRSTPNARGRLREAFAEELAGIRTGKLPGQGSYFDTRNRSTDAEDLLGDGRRWWVADTAFGCEALTLVDMKGGFILLTLDGDIDVLVEFDRPVDTSDRPSQRRFDETRYDPVPTRGHLQYLEFLRIAAYELAKYEKQKADQQS